MSAGRDRVETVSCPRPWRGEAATSVTVAFPHFACSCHFLQAGLRRLQGEYCSLAGLFGSE